MKNLFLLLLLIISNEILLAQTGGYKTLTIATGMSITDSRYITVMLENDGDKRIHTGIVYEALFYSKYKNKRIDFGNTTAYNGLGFYLSSSLSNSRNYDAQFYFGGVASTNFSKVIYYPFLGLSQSFFLSSKLQLFISERISYLMNLNEENWQPAILGGIKILL